MSVLASLTALFEVSIRSNWDNRALSDYGGSSYTFRDVGARILAIHEIFRQNGINKGDKVALLGKNSSNWGIIYIATVTYGAVIVPILPDFKPADITLYSEPLRLLSDVRRGFHFQGPGYSADALSESCLQDTG